MAIYNQLPYLLFASDVKAYNAVKIEKGVKIANPKATKEEIELNNAALVEYNKFKTAVLQTQKVTVNGKIVNGMEGISFESIKSLITSIGQVDLTKNIVWAYKMLWEESSRQNGSKESVIANWNTKIDWKDMRNWNATTQDNDIKSLMKDIFFKLPTKDASEDRDTKALDEWLKKATGVSPEAGKSVADMTKRHRGMGEFYVLTPIRRFSTDKFTNASPHAPSWLDKMCLKYVPAKYELLSSPNAGGYLRGWQHQWHNASGDKKKQYRKEAIGKNTDQSADSTGKRFPYDSIIQQTFEYKEGWYNLGINWVSTKPNATKTNWTVYNPFYPETNFSAWKETSAASKSNFKKKTMVDFDNNLKGIEYLCAHAANVYPKNILPRKEEVYNVENALKAIQMGGTGVGAVGKSVLPTGGLPLFWSAQRLFKKIDNLWTEELAMGVKSRKAKKVAGKNTKGSSQSTKRTNLLNPLYNVQVNKTWMGFSIRMVIFLIDAINKGVIIPKDDSGNPIKPFVKGGVPGKNFVKILVNLIWSFFDEFSEIIQKHKDLQEANKKIAESGGGGDGGGIKTKDVHAQILKNMQCFMLNMVDVFASFHKRPPYKFATVEGDNANIFNLLGYKPKSIEQMLSITPAQLALMQPRIKLFKERRFYKPNSSMLKKVEIVEVAGPFSTHTSTQNLKNMLSSGGGRSLGGGIQEVTLKEHSGDADFGVESTREVEIKFLFNTLQEMFLNFPALDKKGNIEFPYGVQPQYLGKPADKVPASFAELAFPLTVNNDDGIMGVVNANKTTCAVILELGWTPPDDDKNLSVKDKKFFKSLNTQNLYRSYVLNPWDIEFNFTDTGQVELTARYYGIVRYLRQEAGNKLFPRAGIAGIAGDTESIKKDPVIVGALEEIKKLKRKINAGKILNVYENNELLRHKQRIKDIFQSRVGAEWQAFVDHQLHNFMGNLITQDQIYVLKVPKVFLGAYGKNNVIRWSPTREIESLRSFPRSVTKGLTGKPSLGMKAREAMVNESKKIKKKQDTDLKTLEVEWTAAKIGRAAGAAGGMTKEQYEAKKAKINKEAATPSKTASSLKKATQEAINKAIGTFSPTDDSWPIFFCYFGDIVQAVFNYADTEYDVLMDSMSNKKSRQAIDQLHYILGSVKMPIVKNKKYVLHDISLADLPITTYHVIQYVTNHLISPGAYNMTRLNFVWGLLKSVIQEFFNATCFVGSFDVARTKPSLTLFNVPSTAPAKKQPDLKGAGGLWNLAAAGSVFTREGFKKKMDALETSLKKNSISENLQFNYGFLGTRSMTDGSYDKERDYKDNIHHFYFGAGHGLIKGISFKSEELPHQTEAILEEGINDLKPVGAVFIPRIFNCDIKMIGNTLFQPGQTFFVDPTMGTMLGNVGSSKNTKGMNIIRDTGLGGYFYVASVETRIGPGVYETTLEGLKTGMTKASDRKTSSFKSADSGQVKAASAPKLPKLPKVET